jgi:hypothetical protein
MVDNANIATALTALVDAITNINNANIAAANAPSSPSAAHAIVLDPFASNAPSDLSTQIGSSAIVTAFAALDDPGTEQSKTFPHSSFCSAFARVKSVGTLLPQLAYLI